VAVNVSHNCLVNYTALNNDPNPSVSRDGAYKHEVWFWSDACIRY